MESGRYGDVPEGGFAGNKEFLSLGFLTYGADGVITETGAAWGSSNLSWFFQWAFCMTSATIVSGAVAERLRLGGPGRFCFRRSSFPVL